MLTISAAQRRIRLMRRHRLATETSAASVFDAAAAMVALHATDPATVYLSALARCPSAALADVSTALYDERTLVKMLAMRRTVFVVPVHLVPDVHGAASLGVAARLRRQLVTHLRDRPTDPPVPADVEAWLAEVEDGTERALIARGEASANDLAGDEPRLRTALLPTTNKKWDVKVNITSRVLTLMAAEGRMVRGRPRGSWFSRHHRWVPASRWWPDGIAEVGEADAQKALLRHWLRVFGPATVADAQWWTGWSLGTTRKALAGIDTLAVDMDGVTGVVLADDAEPEQPPATSAALLPALDPTPMGWQQRDWFLGSHREALFDRNGNIGPTVWWDGRIVGGWAVRGVEVVWRLLDDVGSEAEAAINRAAGGLQERLESATVVPSFRTPLERELSA